MKLKMLVVIMIMIMITGCALFGIFSFNKNGGKEDIEMKIKRVKLPTEFFELHPGTITSINVTWDAANSNWKMDMNMYVDRYNLQIVGQPAMYKTAKEIWVIIVSKIVERLNLQQPVIFDVDSCFPMLAMPEGGDETVYWFVLHSHLPMLGFNIGDFLYQLVP